MFETMFIAAQAIAFLGWLALFALPWTGRRGIKWARWIGALLAILYLAYLLPNFTAIPRDQGYTLAALSAAFDTPALLLAGWIHYLVLDLWVGSWEAEHAERNGVPHAWLLPCLFATMMLAPLGLLIYLGVSALRRKPVVPA